MTYEEKEGKVVVHLKGHALKVGIQMNIHIEPQGTVYNPSDSTTIARSDQKDKT